MPRSQDTKNMNGLSIEAASNWSLGRTLRQKYWPSKWWDSGPPGEEVQGIYNEVYQQKRLLGPPPYGSEQMEALDREICASLDEWIQRRQGTTRPEEDQRGATMSIIQLSHQAKSHHQTWGRNEDPHDQVLKEAKEAHQRALEAAHLLEQDIERLSWAASRAKCATCWHPYRCSHSKRRPQGRWGLVPKPPWAKKTCDLS